MFAAEIHSNTDLLKIFGTEVNWHELISNMKI